MTMLEILTHPDLKYLFSDIRCPGVGAVVPTARKERGRFSPTDPALDTSASTPTEV